MSVKGVKMPPDKRVAIITKISFGTISGAELSVLEAIIKYSSNNAVTLSIEVAKQIKSECNISDTGFSTSIHRLVKKKIITKEGKTIWLHPLYNGIMDLESFVISFRL